MFKNDGSKAIDRIMEAYGFRFRNDLCRHVGISSSTLSTWQKRNSFPSDLAIKCVLDTGVSLQWLTTGEGRIREHFESDVIRLPSATIINGELKSSGSVMYDKLCLPNDLQKPFVLRTSNETYLLDRGITDHTDGLWLVEIEGKVSVRELAFVPVKKVKVLSGSIPFDCMVDEIKIISRVITITKPV